ASSLPNSASCSSPPKRWRISSSVASDLVNHNALHAKALSLVGSSAPSQYSNTCDRRGSSTWAMGKDMGLWGADMVLPSKFASMGHSSRMVPANAAAHKPVLARTAPAQNAMY